MRSTLEDPNKLRASKTQALETQSRHFAEKVFCISVILGCIGRGSHGEILLYLSMDSIQYPYQPRENQGVSANARSSVVQISLEEIAYATPSMMNIWLGSTGTDTLGNPAVMVSITTCASKF